MIESDPDQGPAKLKLEKDLKRKIEVSQIKKQIEILMTFMPDEILYMRKSEMHEVHNFVGVLLFADVSGFTSLCEKYNKTGKGGIYRLTATLNAYIGAIVEVIYFFGGDVLKFSGDAFLALWKAKPDVCLYEVIHEVIVCALFIQQTLGFFETEVNVLLKVKLAISCGNMSFSVIGDEQFKHYVIMGQAINDVKAAEHVSVSGDVVISPGAWGHLAEESYDVTHAKNGNVKVWRCLYKANESAKQANYQKKFEKIKLLCDEHIELRAKLHQNRNFKENVTDSKLIEMFVQSLPPRHASKIAVQRWILSELSPFIIRPVSDQVQEKQPLQYLTEMREVTIQFINIIPSSFKEDQLVVMVDNAYKIVCGIVSNVLGVVNKVSLFDKDVMLLVLFGLKGIKHELESQNALKSGFQIRKEISMLEGVQSVSVGITNGLVYCGVVGHPLRKEYTVIGGDVNKAARIMCAYEHKVTCDYETYKHSKLSSTYFQLQSAFKLKGIENAGHIFEYNEDFEDQVQRQEKNPPAIGRGVELEYINELLTKSDEFFGVLVKGPSKSGKTFLLDAVLNQFSNNDDYMIASVTLCEGAPRPYICVSLLYRQLYDMSTTLETPSNHSILTLKRNLWDLNEILQKRSILVGDREKIQRKTSISEMFINICQNNSKKIILFVDDIQNIDSRSFETIQSALKAKSIKVLCAGTFDEKTWNVLFKFSLSDSFKVLDLEPIDSSCIPILICQFLKVQGVPQRLCTLVENTCEGRPGWIQSCLLKLVNNSGIKIEYVLPDEKLTEYVIFPPQRLLETRFRRISEEGKYSEEKVIPIVVLTRKKTTETKDDLTLAAISLDLFDSFTPYEQLIIKTGAVLGEIFTRALLVVMLKYPNMQVFTKAMGHLFEEDVFECGSKFITSGGIYSRQTICICYNAVDKKNSEFSNLNFPKYAFCKNLHFKNKTLRSVAYELIPANQKKELHLRTTEILEAQNNSCPNCLRDNSASIFRFSKFKCVSDMSEIKNTNDAKHHIDMVDTMKNIIRSNLKKCTNEEIWNEICELTTPVDIPKRKVWDPTICFCLEIMTRVYGDLVYHSDQAGHVSKTIFFLYQNGLILYLMDELEDAVNVLKEASQLSVKYIYHPAEVSSSLAKLIFGKVCSLLAEIYYNMNNWVAAKNYVILTLRQYNVPMTFMRFNFNFKCIKLDKILALGRKTDTNAKDSIGKCLSILSRIYAAEGNWEFATIIANRSLDLVKHSNPNIELLCDVYSMALDMYSFKGNMHICEQLERNLGHELLRLYGNSLTSEIFSIAKLMFIVFQIKAKCGQVSLAVRVGFRLFDLNHVIYAYVLQAEVIPILAHLLILSKRIEEATYTARYIFNVGRKIELNVDVIYYAICLILIIESNFYLEPIENIEYFANDYFGKSQETVTFTTMENTIIVYMNSYYVREGKLVQAVFWKRMYNFFLNKTGNFYSMLNHLKYMESALICIAKNYGMKNVSIEAELKKIGRHLQDSQAFIDKWYVFMPRLMHYKAYYNVLMRNSKQSKTSLMDALGESEKLDNLLEQSWITLSINCWRGHYNFSANKPAIHWHLARSYMPLQWSQIMYPLPLS